MKRFVSYFLAVPTLFILISCTKKTDLEKNPSLYNQIAETPSKHFRNFDFNPSSSITERIKTNPDTVLPFLKELDNRPGYTLYKPNSNEVGILKKMVRMLPRLHKKILKERLLGIYFIKNFLGNGLTDWVIDKKYKTYVFIVFDSKVFNKNFSGLVTAKENTCFIQDDRDIKIKIETSFESNGFFYILMHEATHAVDYVQKISPYVDKGHKYIQSSPVRKSNFTRGIWKDFKKPVKKYNFPERSKLSFYGFRKGPHIKISDAGPVYKRLSLTPFVSLYGATSWAEDVVELFIYYHITQVLNNSYKIKILKDNKVIQTIEPMNSDLVKKRFKYLEKFYN